MAGRLKRDINLSVLPDVVDVGGELVASFQGLEDLVVVDKSLVAVVYNALETEIRLFPDEDRDWGRVGECSCIRRSVNGEIVNGEIVTGEIVDGVVINGEIVIGEVINGEIVNGVVVIGESAISG